MKELPSQRGRGRELPDWANVQSLGAVHAAFEVH